MIKQSGKYLIEDSVLGEVVVNVVEVVGGMVRFENLLYKYSGMCHESIFKKMMKG